MPNWRVSLIKEVIIKYVFLSFLTICLLLTACVGQVVRFKSQAGWEQFASDIVGYLRKPKGDGPFPAVILMHGCSGLDENVMAGLQEHASHFVRNGFATLIIDSFDPRKKVGDAVCRDDSEIAMARSYRIYDAYNGLVFLQSLPFVSKANIFLVGQSNGGSVALMAAGGRPYGFTENVKFQAIVAYYPWCGVLPVTLVSPLMIFGAEQDDWTSPVSCKIMQEHTRGEEIEVFIYKGVHHSFDLPITVHTYAGHTVGGNYRATIDSRKRMLRFFRKYLK